MSTAKKIRVLIVDDSAFMRKVIGDMLSAESDIEVVARARNGDEAMRRLHELSPDVVTLDVEMPGKNGLDVLRDIMAEKPVPVVMVSSLTKHGADVTMQALAAGAVEFVTKPSGSISLDMEKVRDELCQKVRVASSATIRNSILRPRPPAVVEVIKKPEPRQDQPPVIPRRDFRKRMELLVIASSTGGPVALLEVIPALPADFPLPILMVQHMPPGFTTSFAQRLNERSKLKVFEACDGLPVRRGTAILAPGGFHLVVEKKSADIVCRLTETPPVRSVRPAADVLFSSVADIVGGGVIALVLTGMGKDGTDGSRVLREKGAYVIAESKETCVIYGMPASVVDSGLADGVLPLYSIASGLVRVAKQV